MRGVGERGPVINQRPYIQSQARINEVCVLVLRFFMFLPAVSLRFSSVLDPKSGLGSLGGKAESACEEFEDNEGGISG